MVTNVIDHLIDLDLLPKQAIIVDAGASHGDFIAALQPHLVGEYHIFAIECNRTNIAKLFSKMLQKCTIIDRALVGDNDPQEMEFTEFHTHNDKLHEWGNLYGNNIDAASRRKEFIEAVKYLVKTISINQLGLVYGFDRIDFLKMDIEGSEVPVLSTMTQDTANRIMQMSIEPHGTRAKVLKLATALGFKFVSENKYDLYFTRKKIS